MMFTTPVLDVAVGLFFTYLLLSLVCSAAKEGIEAWLNKRATTLDTGVRELLDDLGGTGLAKEVYEHPLVNSLFRGAYAPAHSWWDTIRNLGRSNLPSYIPARNFALALLDVVRGGQGAPAAGGQAPSLRDVLGGIANANVRRALLTLAGEAGDDVARLQAGVEAWFNSAMDRVSGWYKQWSQAVILALGVAVTVGLNADTLAITATLSRDPLARQRLIDAAEKYTRDKQHSPQPPGPAKADPAVPGAAGAGPAAENPSDPTGDLRKNLKQIGALGLPLGWDADLIPGDAGAWAYKVAGWLLTVLALSLGAPFWFDLLNKFMVVRSTVKPQEKSPPEPAKG
jgi:hypothetical protein